MAGLGFELEPLVCVLKSRSYCIAKGQQLSLCENVGPPTHPKAMEGRTGDPRAGAGTVGGPGLTRLSSSGLEEKSGLSERTWGGERGQGGHGCLPPALPAGLGLAARGWVPTCLAKAAMSSLKESEEQTSLPRGVPGPAPAPSRGEQVANSHFSKTRASSGKSGCLERTRVR